MNEQTEIRTAVLTGASGGIGSSIARGLALRGYRVVMAVRNLKKGEAVRQQILLEQPSADLRMVELDLSSIEDIRSFPDRLKEQNLLPSVLVNNAGVMCKQLQQTADGLEMSVGVNYVATYMLSLLMIEGFAEGQPLFQVINTTSLTYRWGRVDHRLFDLPTPLSYSRFPAYMNSKLAVLMFTAELGRRCKGKPVTVNAVDPGVVNTGMITMNRWYDPLADLLVRPIIRSPQQGAKAALRAVDEGGAESGFVYHAFRRCPIPGWVDTHPLNSFLWEETAKRTKVSFA